METPWLSADELRAWRAFRDLTLVMEDTLDQQLRHDSGPSHLQYSVLVFLSEAPEGRLRMTDLAENLKYGFGYPRKLLAQNPKFVRGTQDSSDLVGTGDYVADFGSGGSASGLSQVTLPKRSPWVAWPQTGAILKNAPHQAAAKLYLSWILSKDAQTHDIGTWSSRTDVAPPAGRKGIFDYKNMNPLGLGAFMSDRTALDRYKARVNLYVGDVQGVNPSDPKGVLGLYPVSQNGAQG
ncbi:hypothetical protein ACIPX0_10005 [Streptomyces sp. NPDC090075]|uniref:hypothetical protein n=1 Tax=Streptomyces sp. NPDC090075 TaxID=3365937 RepID=UPI00380CA620